MKLKNVEDIYPLSPMQETMHFHASMQLNKSENESASFSPSDVLFNQVHLKVLGQINTETFFASWQCILDRHQSLRTAFVFNGLKTPQQIVRQKLQLPHQIIDVSKDNEPTKNAKLAAILEEDKRKGFALEKAPLMRITLVRFSGNEHHLVWSTHHLIIDRWCIPILFNELASFYLNGGQSEPRMGKAPQFKRYIAWLKKQDSASCSEYWHNKLSGFSYPTYLTETVTSHDSEKGGSQESRFELSSDIFNPLVQQSKNHTLTLATLVRGAWAILLSQICGRNDVLFGTVVSGRPTSVPDIESIVGSFVNNMPLRAKLAEDTKLLDWLRTLQRDSIKQSKFEYLALSDLHQFTALESDQNLFDSILLWLAPAKTNEIADLKFQAVSAGMRTAFPLTLSVEEVTDGLAFTCSVAQGSKLSLTMKALFSKLANTLKQFASLTDNTRLAEFNLGGQASDLAKEKELAPVMIQASTLSQSAKAGRERVNRKALVEFLAEQWKLILQLEKVNEDEDFFALGGDSLKAVQLLQKLEQLERKTIPLVALFQGRTINEMADIVLKKDWPVKAGIVTAINKNGSQRPLFCIASPEVNTLGFANLAHHMGSDFPVYILQLPPNKDAIEEPEAGEIPEMATEYIQGVLATQAEGPYRLLGMCSGSQIAIEMARQMEQRGIPLDYLAQINTWAFYTVSNWYYLEKLLNLFRYYKKRFTNLTFDEIKQRLFPNNDASASADESAQHIEKEATSYQPLEVVEPANGYSIINDVGWVNRKPELKKISQKVTVFRLAHQSYWRINDEALGWGNQAQTTEVVHLDGRYHMAILRESHVQQLAQRIKETLPSDNVKRL